MSSDRTTAMLTVVLTLAVFNAVAAAVSGCIAARRWDATRDKWFATARSYMFGAVWQTGLLIYLAVAWSIGGVS